MNREELEKKILIVRELKIRKARENFWEFEKLIIPSFFKEGRQHLKDLADTLQAFYERRIIKFKEDEEWQIIPKESIAVINLTNAIICTKLMLNMPPQHGKSLSLTLFEDWVLGQNVKERIVTVSYNQENAISFSETARNIIQEENITPGAITYKDIFPNVKVDRAHSNKFNWALEGQPFTYLGKGLGSGVTGKGFTLRIIDDPIKEAAEAFNPRVLDDIWNWYTGTFASRISGNDFLDIVNHTRWADKDLCGRLLELQPEKWYVFKREVYDEKKDTMLCEEILNKSNYLNIKSMATGANESIFYANYHQRTMDMANKLYSFFKPYKSIPLDEKENTVWEKIIAYVDTADEGADYLCAIVAGIYNKKAYILDVYYTQDPMEITEYKTAELLFNNNVNTAFIESNNGGRGFARNVETILKEKFSTTKVKIKWFHQSGNKRSRILTNSSNVMNDIYFPIDWHIRWSEFYTALNSVNSKTVGTNRGHDDAPDALTGIIEKMDTKGSGTGFFK